MVLPQYPFTSFPSFIHNHFCNNVFLTNLYQHSFGFGTDRYVRNCFLHQYTDPNGYLSETFTNIFGDDTTTKYYLGDDYIISSVVLDEFSRVVAEVDHYGNTNSI